MTKSSIEAKDKKATSRPVFAKYFQSNRAVRKAVDRVKNTAAELHKTRASSDRVPLETAKWIADTYGTEWGGDITAMQNAMNTEKEKSLYVEVMHNRNKVLGEAWKLSNLRQHAIDERYVLAEQAKRRGEAERLYAVPSVADYSSMRDDASLGLDVTPPGGKPPHDPLAPAYIGQIPRNVHRDRAGKVHFS